MTIKERITKALQADKWDMGDGETPADAEKMIRMAYYIGREAAAREVSGLYSAAIADMMSRAAACRYHHLARRIVGEVGKRGYIYHPDYAGDMGSTFGDDLADI